MNSLKKTLDFYAKAARKASGEIAARAAQLFAQNAQKETLLQTGQGKRGRASSFSVAARNQKEALRKRILEQRLKRRARRSSRKVYLSKAESLKHWREVKSRLREIAAPFTAAIIATGGKIQTSKLKKIGAKHGSFRTLKNAGGRITSATVSFRYPASELSGILKGAKKTVQKYFERQAGAILRKELKAARAQSSSRS